MKKILIIYSKTGGGHLSLALALEQALQQLSTFNYQLSTSLFDPFPKIYASGYKTVGANFQEFWGKNFHLTNRPELAKAIHNLNNVVVRQKLIKAIKKENPDVVITTHFFASVELEKAIKKVGSAAKIVVAIADPFTPHAVWFTYKNADLYLSPTKEVTQLTVENGIDKEKIVTTGWLVRKEFRERLLTDESKTEIAAKFLVKANVAGGTDVRGTLGDSLSERGQKRAGYLAGPANFNIKTLRKILGFDENKFTIFIGGGGSGGGKIYELAKLLAKSQIPASPAGRSNDKSQLVVVCGNNRQLMSKLMKLAEINPGLFHLFPYVNNVRQLMAASDIVVGKAGPNILFESIFMLKPFLATGCLPGQEEGNLEFIKKENLGWVLEEPEEAVKLLENLSNSSNLILEKLPNLKRIRAQHLDSAKNAAAAIAKLIS